MSALILVAFTSLMLQEPAPAPPGAPIDPPPAEALPLEPPPPAEPPLEISQDPPPPGPVVAVTAPGAPVVAPMTPPPPRRLVVAFLPSITMGISPMPSQNLALFLGGRLPDSPWALGYQFTFSNGLAERYFLGFLTHRHHITAMRAFGARGRGFTSVGGGAAFLAVIPVVEVEGRIGVRWGTRKYGVFGAIARVGWNIGYREQAPMPQLGLFLGVALF